MALKQSITDKNDDPALVGTKYSVRSPHPGFGVDPNIKNEYGHTNYPKWIDHPWKKDTHVTTTYVGKDKSVVNRNEKLADGSGIPLRVYVNNEAEEKTVMAEKPSKADLDKPNAVKEAPGWNR